MRLGLACLLVSSACATPVDPAWPDVVGSADDPAFCVNVEADGRKYTADDSLPSPVQVAAGVSQGRYPYPVRCTVVR
jgi:hypothetical protein